MIFFTVFRQVGIDTDNLISKFGLLNKSFADIKRDFQNGQGIRSLGNVVKKEDINNLKNFSNELKNGVGYSQAYKNNLANSHTYIKKQGLAIAELYKQQNILNKQVKSGKITQEEYKSQMSANQAQIQAITTQTGNLTFAQKALSVASKAAGIAIKTAFNIGIALLINGIITLISKAVNYQKELAEKTKELGQTAKDTTKDIATLYAEYLKLNNAVANGTGSKEDLKSATDSLISSLGLEGIAVDELIKKYGTLEKAMAEMSVEKLKEAHNNLVSSVDTYKDELLKKGGNGFWGKKNTFTISNKDNDYLNFKDINDKGVIEALQSIKGLRYEIDAAEGASTDFVRHSFELLGDPKTVEGIKQNYETLMDMQDVLIAKFGATEAGSMGIYKQITKRLDELKTAYENYTNEVTALNTNAAKTAVLESLKGKELPKTQEEFKAFYDNLINEATTAKSELRNQFIGTEDEIENAIKAAIEGMSAFDEFTADPIPVDVPVLPSVSTDTSKLKSNLEKVKEEIENTFKNTDLFDKAIESLNKGEAIDFDDVMSMVEVDGSLADKFIQTADGYTIALEDLSEARQNYITDTQNALQADIDSAKATIQVAENNIKELKAKRDVINPASDITKWKAYDNAIKSEEKNVGELSQTISENTLILGEMTKGVSSAESSIEKLSTTLEKASKKQSVLKSAMEDMADTGYISASTYAELVELGGNFVDCLEIQDGRLTLNIEKLKELEKQEYLNVVAANELRIAELQLAKDSIKSDPTGYLTRILDEQINELNEQNAFYNTLVEEIGKVKPSGGSSSNDDPWKEKAEKEIADVEHKYAMEQITYEEYINEIDRINQEYFSKNKKYLDDYRKYEEKVYEGRKKLAEDLYNDRIEKLESQITVAEDKSLDSNGNFLDVTEKFNYIRDTYSSLIAETQNRIDEIVKSGVKGQEDEIKKLEKQIEDYKDKFQSEFGKYVNELEEYADELSKTSVNSDGIELNTQEKFREVAAVYTNIQNEIQSEINRIIQTGIKGNEKLLEELEKQLKEYADKVTDTFKSAVETEKSLLEHQKSSLSDVYDKEIDKIKKQQDDAKKSADAEIDLIQEKIDNLKKVNDEKQQEYDIEKAKQNLEKAKQKTRMVYGADGTVSYRADTEKISEAQQNLDKLLLEKQVNTLETQKSLLEDMRDKESESYDKLIEDIESQKEQDERQFDILIQRLEDYLNPNSDTSNSDVWSEIAKMDGATYRNGKWVDKDGTEIDINALLSKVDEKSGKDTTANKKTENEDKTQTDKGDAKKNDTETNKANEGDKEAEKEVSQTENVNNQLETAADIIGKIAVSGEEFIEKILKNLGVNNLEDLWSYSSNGVPSGNEVLSSQHDTTKWSANQDNHVTNNTNQPVNMTFGDINVNNPVGDAKQLAQEVKGEIFKEAMMQIPNDAMKIIYSNLR